MSNIYVALPAPAANGAGAAVDVSSFGAVKTITVAGSGGQFEPFVTIEISNQVSPTKWAPLWTFFQPGEKTFTIAAIWMRAVVSNYRTGPALTVDVGSNFDSVTHLSLVAPAGNGAGTGVSSTSLPLTKTIQVCGPFRGALNIDISEDGGVTYNQLVTFYSPGQKTMDVVAGFMRVSRNGVPQVNAGLPTVEIAALASSGGGGGGGAYQIINYVATGGETDFMVTIATPMANDTYGLLWAPAGMANIPGNLDLPNLLAADRTLTQFRVTTTALTAGDKITFMVFPS